MWDILSTATSRSFGVRVSLEGARNSAASVAEILMRTERTLAVAGQAIADAPDEHGLPAALLATEPALVEVVQLDEEGTVLAAAFRDQPVLSSLFTLSQSKWFHAALAGHHYRSRVQYTFENDPYLILSLPAKPQGVVVGRIHLDVLQNAVSTLDLGETGRIYIVDAEGEVIAHADRSMIGQQVDYVIERTKAVQNNGAWSGEYTDPGKARDRQQQVRHRHLHFWPQEVISTPAT